VHATDHSGSAAEIGGFTPAGTTRRDDLDMSEAARECAVCHRIRTRGSRGLDQDVFICVGCDSAAEQFLKIQDHLYDGSAADGSAAAGD
jgi:hypothetical protein